VVESGKGEVTYGYDSNARHVCLVTHAPQEEGDYEYISEQQGGTQGKEAHIEPAVLYEPLNEEEASDGEGATMLGSQVPLCQAGSEGRCAREVQVTCHGMGRCPKKPHRGGGGKKASGQGCSPSQPHGPEAGLRGSFCEGGSSEEGTDLPTPDPSGPFPNPEIPGLEPIPVPG
jgi:hypothetical protein